ncbi:hypothetical protein SDRG_12935 [Saprolegnia diclina VS20]|uniref:FHA domain-containing protein n=1 Tax=Saprolegnia diclina (strain VS20) TaxID=1156394 RepID=T0RHH9_SAPDV|nr:hypothetical protein SDRG_12935 [Saprolegnia diclina VS20]EQC29267.1 hypothetical protein SDRG_12935 [Saprolegnia diclina VS20]|eukprot:XP_008617241.1 hypothetical protein SDRG_12935 [Saprolegnia diclina VS20]
MHCLELNLSSLPATTRRAIRRLKLHREMLQLPSLILCAGTSFSTPFGSATQEQQAALRRCAQHTIAVRVTGEDVYVTGTPINAVLVNATPVSSHTPHRLADGDIITLASGNDFVIAYVLRTNRGAVSSPDQLINLTSASSTTEVTHTTQGTWSVETDAGNDGTLGDMAKTRDNDTETSQQTLDPPVIALADNNADESPMSSAIGDGTALPDVLDVDAIVYSPQQMPRRSKRLVARKEKALWRVLHDSCTVS